MKVTLETVNYISKLAKLKFEEDEAKEFADEFEKILTHFENIEKEDLSDVSGNKFEDEKSVLRKDDMKIFEDKEQLFKNVKKMRDNCIELPKIID